MFSPADPLQAPIGLLATARGKRFGTVLADPPWQFQNRTGKVAPEHERLIRCGTISIDDTCALPIDPLALSKPTLATGGYAFRVCTMVSTSISVSDAIA